MAVRLHALAGLAETAPTVKVVHRDRHRFVTTDDGHTCVHPYEPTEPSGYVAWHEWAPKYAKTHKQKPCPDCGIQLWISTKADER